MPVDFLVIRKATLADLPPIVALLAQDTVSGPPEPASPTPRQIEAFELISRHADHEMIVGEIRGEVVATLQLSFIPGLSFDGAWRAQVEGVRVRRDRRSKGIGEQMMRWVIDRAREKDCRLIQLTSNRVRVDAQRFYVRLGFEATHVGMKLYL